MMKLYFYYLVIFYLSYIQRDRSRDQSLRAYGIFIERFDWKDCQQQPDCVVKRFLDLLDSNR